MTGSSRRWCPSGYVSFLLVLSMGVLLMLLMVFAYRRAAASHSLESTVQLQVDYREKEETILRSIVAITPNRAIRAMQHQSNANTTNSNPLTWEAIFTGALDLANARQSISSRVLDTLGTARPVVANSGDSHLDNVGLIFRALGNETGIVSAGINRSLGSGYPVPLSCADPADTNRDQTWPIISNNKVYGSLAQAGLALPANVYPHYNVITYPNTNFGYCRPGQPFVAKRNWWGFSVNLAEPDAATTRAARATRDFVLSIYEIPSQLAISASSVMALGRHASGDTWEDVTIAGGVFAGRAEVEGITDLTSLATRRGLSLSGGATVGGQNFTGDPLAPGIRETYQLTKGDFFPVSQASESGRAAFIPINRGADYFDRFAHSPETSALSSTTWNNYSIGALQCAMRLDIIQAASATDKTPTVLRFSYLKGGERHALALPLASGAAAGLPVGYIYACGENQTYDFGTSVVDLAYGRDGTYCFQTGMTGSITFNNARFGDSIEGAGKSGYFKPSCPFELKFLTSGKPCIAIYPKRIAAFLTALGADSTATNHSLVVNVDYTVATGSAFLTKPAIPSTDLDYGVILQECSDLTSFTKGFSLVTNMRLYIGDDFNVVPAEAPTGYPQAGGYFPPCSVFAPEKRYGVTAVPLGVKISGQLGSLASDSASSPVHPLDAKSMRGSLVSNNRIHVNLRPITHPADVPPVFMMNWLVLLEERRREFQTDN